MRKRDVCDSFVVLSFNTWQNCVCFATQEVKKKKNEQQAELLKTFRLNEAVSAVSRFSLKSQIIPSLGVDVRAADSSAATANRQTEERAKKTCLPEQD